MLTLVTVIVNRRGRLNYIVLDNQEYVRVPVTLIVEGVLNGSRGPLFYPKKEFAANFKDWNGVPLLLDHPQRNGKAVAANGDAAIIKASGLGFIEDAKVVGNRLRAFAYFHVGNTKRVSPIIWNKLVAGEKIEVSTGLGGDLDKTEGTYNGKHYKAIYRNYVPDHLAVFEDKVGACNINDGCGVNNFKETEMDREKKIQALIANCSAWTEEDRKTLNGLSEDNLTAVYERHLEFNALLERSEEQDVANEELEEKVMALNEEMETLKAEVENAKNSGPDMGKVARKRMMADMSDEELENEMTKRKDAKNKKSKKDDDHAHNKEKPVAIKLEDLPPEMQAVYNHGREALEKEKASLINKLTANLEGDALKNQSERLAKRSLEELRSDAELIPAHNEDLGDDEFAHHLDIPTGNSEVPGDVQVEALDFQPMKF